MKIRVHVSFGPQEADAAASVERELRTALGGDGDVVLERGPSSASQLSQVEAILRDRDHSELSALEQVDLGSCLSVIACGSDGTLRNTAVRAVAAMKDSARRTFLLRAVVGHATNVLTSSNPKPTRAQLRAAAAGIHACVQHGLLQLGNATRTCLTLLRTQETVVSGAVLLAVLLSTHAAELQQAPEVAELRKTVAAATPSLPTYESVYIAEGMQWATSTTATNFKTLVAQSCGKAESAYVCGIAALPTLMVGVSSDGTICTFDHSGNKIDEANISADAIPTAVDGSTRAKQFVVACNAPSSAPQLRLYSDSEGGDGWAEVGRIDGSIGNVVTAVRFVRSSPHVCAAECGTASSAVAVFDCTTGAQVSRHVNHPDVITTMHVPASREHLVMTGARDRTVALFDVRTGARVSTLAAHSSTISSVSSEGDVVVVAGLDGKMTVSDLRALNTPVGRRTFETAVLKLALGPSHLCLVSTQHAVHLMSLHSADMPITRLESRIDRPPVTDALWIPGRGMLCLAAGRQIDFTRCDQPQ
jgi:hypothetical protein